MYIGCLFCRSLASLSPPALSSFHFVTSGFGTGGLERRAIFRRDSRVSWPPYLYCHGDPNSFGCRSNTRGMCKNTPRLSEVSRTYHNTQTHLFMKRVLALSRFCCERCDNLFELSGESGGAIGQSQSKPSKPEPSHNPRFSDNIESPNIIMHII